MMYLSVHLGLLPPIQKSQGRCELFSYLASAKSLIFLAVLERNLECYQLRRGRAAFPCRGELDLDIGWCALLNIRYVDSA